MTAAATEELEVSEAFDASLPEVNGVICSDHLDGEPRPRALVQPQVVPRGDSSCDRRAGGFRGFRCVTP